MFHCGDCAVSDSHWTDEGLKLGKTIQDKLCRRIALIHCVHKVWERLVPVTCTEDVGTNNGVVHKTIVLLKDLLLYWRPGESRKEGKREGGGREEYFWGQ